METITYDFLPRTSVKGVIYRRADVWMRNWSFAPLRLVGFLLLPHGCRGLHPALLRGYRLIVPVHYVVEILILPHTLAPAPPKRVFPAPD